LNRRQRRHEEFGLFIMRFTLLLVLFVLLVNTLLQRPWLETFLFAVALAVGTAYYHSGSAYWQTMIFTVLCFSQIGQAFATRSSTGSFFKMKLLGNRLLLARNHRFPTGRYSVIAGYVEPGRDVEEQELARAAGTAYETYLARMHGRAPLSREAFYLDGLRRRYQSSQPTRCC
jgi:hypothetical protein